MFKFKKTPVDVLAIGDLVTDAFIKIKEARVEEHPEHSYSELCLRFGDKVPYESVEVVRAVGNAANAAVSASRLGLNSGLNAIVGDDHEGKLCLTTLESNNVNIDYMGVDKTLPTNYHYVLWYGVERTILIKHSPFERHLPKNMVSPKWIYFSSLGANTEAFHHEIAGWLKEHPETKLAFQPGTFQIKLGLEHLKDIYEHTDIFFCNTDEARRILGNEETDVKKLMDMVNALGPKIVVITDGIAGAYARDIDGKHYFMPVYPHVPFERTGAGDAFSSTVMSAIALGKDLKEALTWAPINAMSVTQKVGAQAGLLSREKLEEFLLKAPADYKLKEI